MLHCTAPTSALPDPCTDAAALRTWCIDVIDQALQLLAVHDDGHLRGVAVPVGAHLRHLIEHFDALLHPRRAGVADYDARLRDPALERSPALASARLQALRLTLQTANLDPSRSLTVRGVAGAQGEFHFAVPSSLGRELAFVASHAVHHFAVLRTLLGAQGLHTDARFGVAPATLAHAARLREPEAAPFNPPLTPETLPWPATAP